MRLILRLFVLLIFVTIASCDVTDPKKDKPKPEGYQEDIPWPSLAGVPWPMIFGDPQFSGRSKEFGPELGIIEWKIKIPATGPADSFLSPVIGKDGTIYFVSYKDIDPPGSFLYALNPDGDIKWRYPLATDKNTSPPIISAKGNIYVADWANNVSCIDVNGKLKWQITLPRPITSIMNIDKEENLYGIALNGILYSFSPAGNIRWEIKIGESGSTSNSISFSPDGHNLFLKCKYGLYSIATSGEIIWKKSDINYSGDYVPALVTSQGRIFTVSGGGIYDSDGTRDTLLEKKIRKTILENDTSPLSYCLPTIDKYGNFYIASEKILFSFDYNGNLRWKKETLPIQDGFGLVCDISGNIYYLQWGYKNYLLICLNNAGLKMWEVELDGVSWDSPAIHKGRMYLGTVEINGTSKYFYSIK